MVVGLQPLGGASSTLLSGNEMMAELIDLTSEEFVEGIPYLTPARPAHIGR